MPSALPDGDLPPPDGTLPQGALATIDRMPFGIYVHVPFCAVRCGYCDFNTYTPGELGSQPAQGALAGYAEHVLRELDLARRVLPEDTPLVSTVFFGGGTPTMLAPSVLTALLDGVSARFGLASAVEVTTEANPDTVTPALVEQLAGGGFTRVSLGMQSSVPHVLKTLDRTHDPRNVSAAVSMVRSRGLGVSLDLIYGTPGESLHDWRHSLTTALDLGPDHVSAYALVVEDGTKLAADVRRGRVPAPTDDDEADKYELADSLFAEAGYDWYEVSNWARTPADECRHNDLYWRGANWWGIGPGAHSHVGGVRWWNVKHPTAYGDRLSTGSSPAAARETLTLEQTYDEWVLLGIRRREGLDLGGVTSADATVVAALIADGLVDAQGVLLDRRLRLTRRGRLLADTVVRQLLAGA